MRPQAARPRARPAELLVEKIDFAKIVAGDPLETAKYKRSLKFLYKPFPPEHRVPVQLFIDGAREDIERTMGGNPHNRWSFILARKGREIVGATAVNYLDDAATMFIGYVRATAGMGGQGLKMLIDHHGASFARAAAKEAGKELRTFSGEMEIPETLLGKAQRLAKERIEKFMNHEWGILGAGTSFTYGEPQENGDFEPLHLMVRSLEGLKSMDPEGVAALVRSIYRSTYDYLKKEIYDTALGRILRSIPKEPLQIVR